MTLVIKESVKLYNYLFYDLADDRLYFFPLVKSPIPITAILTVYLLFVLKWGPRFMKNREQFDLRRTLIIYNCIQMAACGIGAIYYARRIPFNDWKCLPIDHPHTATLEMQMGGYIYFISKIVDLLDTIYFVLKKNYRQITFLHVFHHSMMIVSVWFGMKYYPGGQSFYIPYINAIVHTAMYGYYLLSVYDDKYKKSIWWKKHITHLQLFQFALIILLYTTPLIYDCGFPKLPCVLALIMNTAVAILFLDFYYKAYIKKNKQI